MLLDLGDGELTVARQQLRARIRLVMDQIEQGQQRLVLATPYIRDPHPDHQAVAAEVVQAGRRSGCPVLQFPVWMTYWMEPARFDQTLEHVQVDPRSDQAHTQAVAFFTSQLEPLASNLSPVLPTGMLDHHSQQLLITTPRGISTARLRVAVPRGPRSVAGRHAVV